MEKLQELAKEMVFDTYPSPVEKIREYTRRYSRNSKVKGHYCIRIIITVLIFFARRLSWKGAYQIGKWIGKLFYHFKVRRNVAMTNLDIVYGDKKSTEEKDHIYRESLINCGRLIINYMRLPYMGESFWRDKCEWKNEYVLQEALNRKKGALLISGHIGMMDLAGGKLGMSGYPVAVVGKRIRNPVLDKLFVDIRNSMNLGTIKHRDSMKRILEGIQRGEAIAMALDQNMKPRQGVFINWMGRVASSVRSAAYVAKKTGAPVIAGYLFQKGPDRFELVATEEVHWESYPDDPAKELLINTQKQSDAIQKIIYEHPELWFWIHRRWKVQPEGMPSPYK
jgi:KDO2-lipid IV(A) lauroyltransferase